jgi:hypothetical protein
VQKPAEGLSRIQPDIRIILSSGYGEKDVSDRFHGEHLTGLIQKPYPLPTLKSLVQKVLNSEGES